MLPHSRKIFVKQPARYPRIWSRPIEVPARRRALGWMNWARRQARRLPGLGVTSEGNYSGTVKTVCKSLVVLWTTTTALMTMFSRRRHSEHITAKKDSVPLVGMAVGCACECSTGCACECNTRRYQEFLSNTTLIIVTPGYNPRLKLSAKI